MLSDREANVPSRLADRVLAGRNLPIAWILVGIIQLGLAALLVAASAQFDWAHNLIDIPARALAAGLVIAGLAFLMVLPLIGATVAADGDLQRRCFGLVVVVGLALRLMMFATEPALEDDQQRYLWEGAVAAHGLSPYALSPESAKSADRNTALGQLAETAGPVLERVNHPHLKTIYPPVAIAAFALAHWISPFSLTAWRGVLLGAECATLLLLIGLLKGIGRPALWSALYWWNPIAIKEIMNSGHMEGVLVPLLLLATMLAARRKPIASTVVLGLAVGVKIWPLLLAPVLLRPWWREWRVVSANLAILAGMCGLWAAPILLGGLDANSGFVAYAQQWQANSALLPALRGTVRHLLYSWDVSLDMAGRIARLMLASIAGACAVAAALRPLVSVADQMRRIAVVTLVLVLVSPAQFPWYMLWTLPFLPFAPRLGVMLMTVLTPLYYLSFHFGALHQYAIFRDRVVWIIWVPIWIVLAVELVAARPKRSTSKHQQPSSED